MEFKNESENTFTDISSESYRIYEYPDGFKITVTNPLKLHVSKSGGHRLFDEQGISHYISPGWRHLSWQAKEGQPNFVK